jgi:hypothetical protein
MEFLILLILTIKNSVNLFNINVYTQSVLKHGLNRFIISVWTVHLV